MFETSFNHNNNYKHQFFNKSMLAQITVSPFDKGRSLSKYVSEVVKYVKMESIKRNLRYELTSMGTMIEGKNEDVWEVLKGAHETMRKYSKRVSTHISIDDNEGADIAILGKKRKIESILEE